MKKNIKVGKIEFKFLFLTLFLLLNLNTNLSLSSDLEGSITEIKVLDKISSKNILVKLKNGDETRHKDLTIKSMKCKNSEFDDNPEITAYIQVKEKVNWDQKKNDLCVEFLQVLHLHFF